MDKDTNNHQHFFVNKISANDSAGEYYVQKSVSFDINYIISIRIMKDRILMQKLKLICEPKLRC